VSAGKDAYDGEKEDRSQPPLEPKDHAALGTCAKILVIVVSTSWKRAATAIALWLPAIATTEAGGWLLHTKETAVRSGRACRVAMVRATMFTDF